MDVIMRAIDNKRDKQTVNQNICSCGKMPLIAENMSRTRYKVSCFCGKESKWHNKIDEAVSEWNCN